MKSLNLLIIFLAELAVLGSVATWGFSLGTGWALRLLAGIGGPALMVVLWWLFGAPDAPHKVHGAIRVVFEAGWFGAGAVALALAGYAVPALALAAVVAVSKGLAVAWHQ
ncbi:YrdB family protein [Streptomyces sp. NPDC058221]|uniref:YrdB family protein n=1 Tax=Streptomyces sp. NPDC058221 TaxID=3346388 RepID=UPI0036ED93E3